MTTEVRQTRSDRDVPVDGPTPRNRRRGWVVGLVALVAVAAVLTYVAVDETHENSQFDRTHAALIVTTSQADVVANDLAAVRSDLGVVNGQVVVDSSTLASDTSKLEGAMSALATATSDVSRQSSFISSLHACLGGVEQALNALATGDQNRAVTALSGVATECAGAIGAHG